MTFVKKYLLFILFPFILFIFSCKKDLLDPIKVTTGTFTDVRDGKVYKTTTIGEYTWLAQNLDFATDSGSCYYDNDTINKEYGRLYTWQAAQAAVPPGWHLPTIDEIHYLSENLGGEDYIGCQIKETGNKHWEGDNSCANNYSELTILPGGMYYAPSNQFEGKGSFAIFWNIFDYPLQLCSWVINLGNDYGYYSGNYSGNNYDNLSKDMFSVRCVKDK